MWHLDCAPLISCGAARLQVIDLSTHKLGRTLRGHAKGVYTFACCEGAGAGRLVSGGMEHDLYAWSLQVTPPLAYPAPLSLTRWSQ